MGPDHTFTRNIPAQLQTLDGRARASKTLDNHNLITVRSPLSQSSAGEGGGFPKTQQQWERLAVFKKVFRGSLRQNTVCSICSLKLTGCLVFTVAIGCKRQKKMTQQKQSADRITVLPFFLEIHPCYPLLTGVEFVKFSFPKPVLPAPFPVESIFVCFSKTNKIQGLEIVFHNFF